MPNSTESRAGAMESREDRGVAALRVLFLAALVVSVAHYLDTWLRYDAYAVNPQTPVQPWMIPTGWVVFTAIGFVGLVQLQRRRWGAATVLFAVYSLSGLMMVMHYVDAPPTAYTAVQNAMIIAQLAAGVAMIGGALWLLVRWLWGGRPASTLEPWTYRGT